MKKEIHWKFNATSDDEYVLKMSFNVDNTTVMKIFDKSTLAYKKKMGEKVEGDVSKLYGVPIPKVYHTKLRHILKGVFTKNINKDLLVDGVKILTYQIVDGFMSNQLTHWHIEINLKGVYIR